MNIFVDTETTGLNEPRLIELCYWIESAPTPITLRCNPQKPIELNATVVNGIRDKDVAMLLPFREQACYQEIKKLLARNDTVVIAHNAVFDVGVLGREGIVIKNSVCTKELAKQKWPNAPHHRLQHLRYWLDIEVGGVAHSALGDVMVLRELWNRLQLPEHDLLLKTSETSDHAQTEKNL